MLKCTAARLVVVVGTLLLMAACATTAIDPGDCPAGTQKLEGCPPLAAIADPAIEELYLQRDFARAKDIEFDPVLLARDADIPITDGYTKFVNSSDKGAHSALAARIWMIENAEHTIDVMYYIFRDDLAGRAILGALCDAVRRGVDVRFMVDSVGSSTLKKKNLKVLESCAINAGFMRNAAGELTVHKARVQAAIFNAQSKIASNPNRRSHDKMIVKDGRFPGKAYVITGGRNIALDYFGILEDGSPNHHSYRDADILVQGIHGSNDTATPIGEVADIYYSLLFVFEHNKQITASAFGDPTQSYQDERDGFLESLVTLQTLDVMRERFDAMPDYMTEGFYRSDVLLAHEYSNLVHKNVVTKAVENLSKSPNSIVNVLQRLGERDFKRVRIVSPYLFAAYYKKDGEVIFDGAQNMLDWLEAHPDSTIEIVTNSVLTSDNFFTQSVIDLDLAPRLLMPEEVRDQWVGRMANGELNPELVESDAWLEMVNHPRLAIYETGRMDDVTFGGEYHHSKLHAKYIIGDDFGFVGTSNFDYRSRLYNSEMGFFFRNEQLARDISDNTDYLISLSYRWGSPEWLEMRQRLRDMKGSKGYTVRHQRGIYKTIKNTGLVWLF